MTNGEFASRVVNDLNALNKDAHISRRWILSIGRTKVESYVAQRWDDGSLWGDFSLLTRVNCVKMIEVNKIECCDAAFELCGTLMRSEKKLPGLHFGSLGPIVVEVSNIDNTMFFSYATLKSYAKRKKRKYADKGKKYYYINDGYLYIPDVHIELVNILFFTVKKREAMRLSSCEEKEKDCLSEWEYEFVVPKKLIEYIVSETVKEASMKVQITTDENPNLDLNQKTQTVQ